MIQKNPQPPYTLRGHSKKSAVCNPEQSLHLTSPHAGTVILGFSLQNYKKQVSVVCLYPVCGILL